MDNFIKFVFFIFTIAPSICRQCDEDIIGFRKLGMHRESNYLSSRSFPLLMMFSYIQDSTDINGGKFAKIFYLSIDFEGNWMDSRSFCKTYDMDLCQFDTAYEYSNFVKSAMKDFHYFEKWTHIGGVSKIIGKHREWYWVGKNSKIAYLLTFAPGQPNNYLGRQNCLGISKEEKTFEFQDIDCHGRFEEKFICQRICRYE